MKFTKGMKINIFSTELKNCVKELYKLTQGNDGAIEVISCSSSVRWWYTAWYKSFTETGNRFLERLLKLVETKFKGNVLLELILMIKRCIEKLENKGLTKVDSLSHNPQK